MTDIREVLDEIEKGLPGVTPGPWAVYEGSSWRRIGTAGHRYDDCAVLYPVVASDGHPDLSSRAGDREANLAHIARLDPQTMLAIIELARKGLAADAGEAVATSVYESAVQGRADFRAAYQRVRPIVRAAEALRDRWRTPGQKIDESFYAAVHAVSEAVDAASPASPTQEPA